MAVAQAVRLGEHSWYVPGPTNVGIVESGGTAVLVDSGNDKDAGRRLCRIIEEKGWRLAAILSTHSNADHIGGNRYLQEKTGCEVWATAVEAAFIEEPRLEPSLLWGGFPHADLRSKFFEAPASRVTARVAGGEERGGLRIVALPGHFLGMVGALAPDGVLFAADALFGEAVLAKHPIPFIYDVAAYRASLEAVRGAKAALVVPSHGEPTGDVGPLVALNLRRVDELEAAVLGALRDGPTAEELVGRVCAAFGVALDFAQAALSGSTVRSLLGQLHAAGRARYAIEGGAMRWFPA